MAPLGINLIFNLMMHILQGVHWKAFDINARFLKNFSCCRYSQIFIKSVQATSNRLPEVRLISSLY